MVEARIGDARLPPRFWDKIQVDGETGCWLWTASKNWGYGVFSWDGRSRRAHRVAYAELVGPIPDGLELDHVRARGCRHLNCCNPRHLEPVTHAVNARRGDGAKRWRDKTHCPKGHPYDRANTIVRARGHRGCRSCDRARKQTPEYKEAKREYNRAYRAARKAER